VNQQQQNQAYLMIEGLKVTVSGTELKELCLKQGRHHKHRASVYAAQEQSMVANQIEPMHYSGGDPRQALKDRRAVHESEANELEFIATHLVPNEQYLLDCAALTKLGITRSRY
jgi:hypothetical protein